MSDWRYVLSQNRATLLAFVFFVAMFAIYSSNHPAGFSANVVQTAANKGVLLALVAMAQTFVVITAGIDLSVGAMLVLTNCVASWIVVGTASTAALGVAGVLLTGLVCGATPACCASRPTAVAITRSNWALSRMSSPVHCTSQAVKAMPT